MRWRKAIIAAALSLADPDEKIDEADLTGLSASQQRQVRRFHQLITSLGKKIATGETTDQEQLWLEEIQQLVGGENKPIHIQKVELCQRVKGYGVYEPFVSNNFIAGREQPIIIYTELDHFQTEPQPNGLFKVRLSQEVILYNETGTLEVWRQPRVMIEDESRNRRRDFFVVQLVHLPSQLGLGRYRLKVRVNDLADDTTDEVMVPIQILTPPSMVSDTDW